MNANHPSVPNPTGGKCAFIEHWTQSDGDIIAFHETKFPKQHAKQQQQQPQPSVTLRTVQLRTLQQENGDQSCGYYSIFFTSKLSQIFKLLSSQSQAKTQTADCIHGLMRDIRSRDAFESFKAQLIDELLTECKRQNKDAYPWTKEHVNSGVLERVYLQYLQNNWFRKHPLKMPHADSPSEDGQDLDYDARFDADAVAKKYDFRYLFDVINLMEFSESALKTNHLPLITMDELEFFFNHRFRTGVEDFKVFVIGSAIHFVVAAVYRNRSGHNEDITLVYCDPQNNDVLYRSRAYLQSHVIAKMQFTSWLKYGWQLHDMHKLAMDSFRGIQFAVTDLLTHTISNLYSADYHAYFIREKLIHMNISNGFLAGFKNHVLMPMVRTLSNDASDDSKGDNDDAPSTGLFVGVNENFNKEHNSLDVEQWKSDCEFVMNAIQQKLKNIASRKQCTDTVDPQHANMFVVTDDTGFQTRFSKSQNAVLFFCRDTDTDLLSVMQKLSNELQRDLKFYLINTIKCPLSLLSQFGVKTTFTPTVVLTAMQKPCDSWQCQDMSETEQKVREFAHASQRTDMQMIKNCSTFAKLWINSYYPSAVIDQNIVSVVTKLESDSYVPVIAMKLLHSWSSLMMVFADANHRKIAEIEDDKFWKRLASTLLVVQMVTQTDVTLTKL